MCEISSSICTSPIGDLSLSYCAKGLHGINQISSIKGSTFTVDANQLIGLKSSTGETPLPDGLLEWLDDYFHRSSETESVPIPTFCPRILSRSHSFQENVWYTLLHDVPFGQTITYGRLAELAGTKNAARAVGSAMRRNPFQILVPCHRVILSNGQIGNYAGGERNSVKSWLLKHEETLGKKSN